jgi:signal peptidase II
MKPAKPKAHLVFWCIAAGGVALDLWTKSAVFDWLRQDAGGKFVVIEGFLNIVMALNDGAAFGFFAGHVRWLVAVSMIALGVVIGVFLMSGGQPRMVHVALGLFAAGISGNLYDRLFQNGQVRDFIDVVYWPGRHWPAFNVADAMLCIAVGLLALANLTGPSSQKRAPQHK